MANSFVGKRLTFPVQLGDRNQISMSSDDYAIRQSIYIIVNTVPGERVMRPDFGCQIHALIFDPANEDTASVAERYVREAVNRWEPRITLHEVVVTPGGADNGDLLITVNYTIKGTHDPRSLVFPYYLIPQ
ncbi:MAG: GPW/gp25 family protein [Chloroflexi bacterium]|nr:GPW/gp25 family protein [Chloroflexota bacterium]